MVYELAKPTSWIFQHSGKWEDFGTDPYVAYYKFLRAVYGLKAWEAYQVAYKI